MEEKIYFMPGDVVTLKQDIPNKPTMLVLKKETLVIKHQDNKEPILRGIKCRWINVNGSLEEAIFNTKDLQKI